MSESEKLLRQMAMEKIVRMDKRLEGKEKDREWQEEIDDMQKQVDKDRFRRLLGY